MAIVLASQSPRRQELLARIGVEDFKTLSLDIDESYPEGLSPEDTVRYIAKKKCDAAAALCAPDDLIITADTMVFWAMTASENRAMRRTRCACCARFPAALTRSARA